MPGRRAAYVLMLLAAYAGAVAWLTWPLASLALGFLPNTLESCRFDAPYSAWAMAWVTHALVTAPARLADANIYHPTPHAFFYGPSAAGALPYYAPVFLATGNPTLATNVTLLGGLALTAWGMHLVVERWTGSRLAGVVAAAALLTNNWLMYVFVPTTPHMATLQCLPWIMLAAAGRPGRFSRALLLLPLVVLQSLTDLVYVMPAVLAPLGLRQQSVWSTEITPTELPITLWFRAVPARVPPALAALIALGVVALAVRRGRGGPARAAWLHGSLWALVGVYLSFGPVVLWNGRHVLLPQAHLPGVLNLY